MISIVAFKKKSKSKTYFGATHGVIQPLELQTGQLNLRDNQCKF